MKFLKIFSVLLFTLFAAGFAVAMTAKPNPPAAPEPPKAALDFTPAPPPEPVPPPQPVAPPPAEKPAPAARPEADRNLQQTVLANFIAWDKELKTLSLDYVQSTTFEGMDISASAGRIYKKGNNIRLDILADGKVTQSALTDKKTIKILDDKGKPVTALSWREWQDSQANKALFDFGNYAALLAAHRVKDFEETKAGYRLVLVPLEGAVYELEFILNRADYFPSEISISGDGVKTRTILSNIKKNTDLKESLFK